MKNKLYITAIGDNTKQILAKQAHFSGMHYAKYVLVSIDENTNQTKTQLYVGDIITVLKTLFLNTGLKEIALGNFKVTLKTPQGDAKQLTTVTTTMLVTAIDAEIHGDGLNSLVRLATSTHIAVAQVIGKRGESEIDYGTILFPAGDTNNANAAMVSWKSVKAAVEKGQVVIHNVTYDTDKHQLIRTNISALDTVYLIVDVAPKAKATQTASKVKRTSDKDNVQKTKLLNNLMTAKSPLVYYLTQEYDLDALQYILKIHTQNEPVDYMLNPAYTVEQLRALHKAYKAGIDIALIADPRISARTMEGVISKFEYGLWKVIDVDNLRKTAEQ